MVDFYETPYKRDWLRVICTVEVEFNAGNKVSFSIDYSSDITSQITDFGTSRSRQIF